MGVNLAETSFNDSAETESNFSLETTLKVDHSSDVAKFAVPPASSIPFHRICLSSLNADSLKPMIEGRIASDGPATAQCLAILRTRLGVRQAIMTPSCTSALEVAF